MKCPLGLGSLSWKNWKQIFLWKAYRLHTVNSWGGRTEVKTQNSLIRMHLGHSQGNKLTVFSTVTQSQRNSMWYHVMCVMLAPLWYDPDFSLMDTQIGEPILPDEVEL